MALDLETIVKQLTDSGIIASDTLKDFIPPKADPKTGEELVQALVKSDKLTNFQAQQVKGGKVRALLLGSYTILAKIGAGGMGQVFKAQHRRMKRVVAIKMLPAAMMKDAAAAARFQREVEAAAKLEHANIVTAYDADQANGVHFLVMQYVDGQDLSAIVKKDGPFPVGKAVNYVLQAARGLEFAHGEGVVHRDIKPANLLLDKKGTVKILDMGLARIDVGGDVAAQAELTGTGTIMGTVDYMAPEQGMSTKHADARADIYSLGCTLHYILIGKATFDGETVAAKLVAHHTHPIPDLRKQNAEIPEQLDTVFKKMVAKKIEDRYQTMTEVIGDLERCQAAILAAGSGSTSVWNKTASDQPSDMSIAFLQSPLKSIYNDEPVHIAPVATKASAGGAWYKNPKVLIGAGAAGFLAVLLGVIVIVRNQNGKEVARLEVAEGSSVEVRPTTLNATPATGKITNINDPAFQAWIKDVQAMPAEKQVEAVSKKLMELNPRFDGQMVGWNGTSTPKVVNGVVTELGFKIENVTDISPVRAFTGLKALNCGGTPAAIGNFSELSPLTGTKLEKLNCSYTQVSDLSPLKGLKLDTLVCSNSNVSDLSPLEGLTTLISVVSYRTKVTTATVSALKKALPNCDIRWDDLTKSKIAEPATSLGPPPPLANAPFNATQAKAHQAAWAKHLGTTVESKNSVGMTLVLIPPGEFLMGSTDEQVEAALRVAHEIGARAFVEQIQNAERPQHRVVISKPFLLGRTEVSVGQFKQFAAATSYQTEAEKAAEANTYRNLGADDSPAALITWNDAVAFCQWLSDHEKTMYRLPTEAEWEYACRAGTTTQFSFGDDVSLLTQYGWFDKNAGGKSQIPSSKLPNAFGLFDMHGNMWEWCQDFWDDKWYEKSLPTDPINTFSSPKRVFRGGSWSHSASLSRSSYRLSMPPSFRSTTHHGFRIVRVLDSTTDSRLASGTATPQPNQTWNTPAFQAWIKEVQALPAEQQIEAVSKKLMELNPGFDGVVKSGIAKGPVVDYLEFVSEQVTDISPVRALAGLKRFRCLTPNRNSSKLSDLSPLGGLRLETFGCGHNSVSDLSPLAGMPLTEITFAATKVSDLSPLRGMPLTNLNFQGSPVSDLSHVRGMRLTSLNCAGSNVSDLSPVAGMPLVSLLASGPAPFAGMKGVEILRQMRSLETIGIDGNKKWPPAEFWKRYDAGEFGKPTVPAKLAYLDPAFQQWIKATQALPAEQQIEAVSKKLMELNPGFDGKVTPKIDFGVVTDLEFITDNVTDISPVRALAGLLELRCIVRERRTFSDISPLRGMQLARLHIAYSNVSDLSPLRGMPLSSLRAWDSLVADLSPLQGMPLQILLCHGTNVSDLSALEGVDLTELAFTPEKITKGLDVARQMKSIKKIGTHFNRMWPAAEFWKKYDAGEFGKPAAPAKKLAYLDPTFQAWVKATQALPAEQQIEAVSKKLMELNPGFDGKVTGADGKPMPYIVNGVVTGIAFSPENVTDISPVRALVGLKVLRCDGRTGGKSKLSDLSPLQGMKLTSLNCSTSNVSDLSPLQGMPLEDMQCLYTQVSSLSPLEEMRLTYLNCAATQITDLSPLKGMPLKGLVCGNQRLSSLSPLKGMSFTDLNCSHSQVSDLSPLESCKSLKTLNVQATKVTSTAIAALQKALPNCKIEWDDPAKAVAGQPNKPWNTPAFQAWMKTVQAMPAEQQIEAVSKKLMELNPGFDGKVTGYGGNDTPKIENNLVTELSFVTNNVTDISPVRVFTGLKALGVYGTVGKTPFSSLAPLEGMSLTYLHCSSTKVSNLSLLKGMPLTILMCGNTDVSDLVPLHDSSSLKFLYVKSTKVTPAAVAALQANLPNCKIEWDGAANVAAAQANKPWNTPAFQAWLKATQALPAEQQIEAVSKKLMELNPGFDGKVRGFDGRREPKVEGGIVNEVVFFTDNVTDISPVRAFLGLKAIGCGGSQIGLGKLADLSPLEGLTLTRLHCPGNNLSSLTPLLGMPLERLEFNNTPVRDLTPLRNMPLTELTLHGTGVADLTPLTGMKLRSLNCGNSRIADLSLLRAMPLESLQCFVTGVKDISPLESCKSLKFVSLNGTKVTSAQVAALQKVLPNCKIEWDDPAKPKTPEPAATGTK